MLKAVEGYWGFSSETSRDAVSWYPQTRATLLGPWPYGEFESKINWVTTGNDTSFPTYAEKEYGRGVDRIMIVKGTCKLSSRAF